MINKLNTLNILGIVKGDKYDDNTLIKILNNNNNILAFLILSNNEIIPKLIALIEYEYFLSMPLLLGEKFNENKPDIFILSNNHDPLNYYDNLYQNILNMKSFQESRYKIDKQDFFKINNDNIKIKDFLEVVKNKKKENNSNINNYVLILLESFDKRNENYSTIPNKDLLTIFINILNCNGIFAFNIR